MNSVSFERSQSDFAFLSKFIIVAKHKEKVLQMAEPLLREEQITVVFRFQASEFEHLLLLYSDI